MPARARIYARICTCDDHGLTDHLAISSADLRRCAFADLPACPSMTKGMVEVDKSTVFIVVKRLAPRCGKINDNFCSCNFAAGNCATLLAKQRRRTFL